MKRYGSGLYTTIHPELEEVMHKRIQERDIEKIIKRLVKAEASKNEVKYEFTDH